MRKYFLTGGFLLFFVPLSLLKAQTRPQYKFVFTPSYGFIYKHSQQIGPLTRQHIGIWEFSIRKLTAGEKEWHAPFHYPELGLDLGFVNFRNPILGKAGYGILFLEKYFTKKPKFTSDFKLGWGMYYTSNPYSQDNFQNVALSTHLGHAVRIETSASYQIGRCWKLRAALLGTHFSNAALKKPNTGINFFSLGLGLSYLPNLNYFKLLPDTFSHTPRERLYLSLAGAFTLSSVGLPGGPQYPGGNLLAGAAMRLNRKSALNIGLDFFFNKGQQAKILLDTTVSPHTDYRQVGVVIGHELYLGKLSFLTQVGTYLYAPYPNFQPVYQRLQLRYWFNPAFFVAMGIKAHYATAEYTEWTLGWKLNLTAKP
jgi:hypothetical protein